MKKTFSILSLVASLFAAVPTQAAYQLLDLSAYLDASGNYAYSSSLNDNNAVAGMVIGLNPVYWTGSAAQSLATLGGSFGMAFGTNNAAQTVGWSNLAGNTNWHATLWDSAGNATDLKGIDASRNSEAFAINNAGKIVGWSYNNAGQDHATLWNESKIIDLDENTGTAHSEAYGINANNQIVGRSTNGSWASSTATLWNYDSSNNNVTATNLGPGEAYAINDSGTIVGVSSNDFAVRWDGITMTMIPLDSLGGLSSVANDINNAGLIVGNTQTSKGYRGVLWSGTTATDINSLLDSSLIDDWLITDAFSINESGNILAYAENAQGNEKTVLLFTASTAAVPESSTSLMLLAGLGLIGFKRRFKQAA